MGQNLLFWIIKVRVIAGRLKGRVIKTSKYKDTKVRPTKTKTKEALFSILYSGKDFGEKDNILDGATILDLCCGTGSLGIESLSRGAKFCYFVDQNSYVLSTLEENLANFGQEGNSRLIKSDIQNLPKAREMCDIIFIDPPYKLFNMDKVLQHLERQGWISNQGIVIIENYFQEDLNLSLDYFTIVTERRYGKTKLIILKKDLAEKSA